MYRHGDLLGLQAVETPEKPASMGDLIRRNARAGFVSAFGFSLL
jgi:hypothetical protein